MYINKSKLEHFSLISNSNLKHHNHYIMQTWYEIKINYNRKKKLKLNESCTNRVIKKRRTPLLYKKFNAGAAMKYLANANWVNVYNKKDNAPVTKWILFSL